LDGGKEAIAATHGFGVEPGVPLGGDFRVLGFDHRMVRIPQRERARRRARHDERAGGRRDNPL